MKINELKIKQDGLTLSIMPDKEAANPRNGEHTTRLFLWGDKDFKGDENYFKSMNEFESLVEEDTLFCKLPVYLNPKTHEISHEKADDESAHIGCICMSKETAKRIYITLDEKYLQIAEKKLKDCIKEYDDYVNGRVLCYSITDVDGDVLDACNGFYPRESVYKTVEEMSNYCHTEFAHLFDQLLIRIEKDQESQM